MARTISINNNFTGKDTIATINNTNVGSFLGQIETDVDVKWYSSDTRTLASGETAVDIFPGVIAAKGYSAQIVIAVKYADAEPTGTQTIQVNSDAIGNVTAIHTFAGVSAASLTITAGNTLDAEITVFAYSY